MSFLCFLDYYCLHFSWLDVGSTLIPDVSDHTPVVVCLCRPEQGMHVFNRLAKVGLLSSSAYMSTVHCLTAGTYVVNSNYADCPNFV